MKIYNTSLAINLIENQNYTTLQKFLLKKTITQEHFVFKKSRLETIFLDFGLKKRQIINEMKIINDKAIFVKSKRRIIDYDEVDTIISLRLSDEFIETMNYNIELENKFK